MRAQWTNTRPRINSFHTITLTNLKSQGPSISTYPLVKVKCFTTSWYYLFSYLSNYFSLMHWQYYNNLFQYKLGICMETKLYTFPYVLRWPQETEMAKRPPQWTFTYTIHPFYDISGWPPNFHPFSLEKSKLWCISKNY